MLSKNLTGLEGAHPAFSSVHSFAPLVVSPVLLPPHTSHRYCWRGLFRSAEHSQAGRKKNNKAKSKFEMQSKQGEVLALTMLGCGDGTPSTQQPPPSAFQHRYEDEINKRTAAENEFVVLKKVSKTWGRNAKPQHCLSRGSPT